MESWRDELYHYGIKGQKWGVRRYQDYDGSYTQAGMKRYNKSLSNYNEARDTRKQVKKLYKQGPTEMYDHESGQTKTVRVTKDVVKEARQQEKAAKKQNTKDYKHLRQDKLGDQGKKLYAEGKTISGNNAGTKILSTIGGISLSAAAARYNQNNKYVDDTVKVLGGVGVSMLAAAGVSASVSAYQNKRLRAYYAHTSNY